LLSIFVEKIKLKKILKETQSTSNQTQSSNEQDNIILKTESKAKKSAEIQEIVSSPPSIDWSTLQKAERQRWNSLQLQEQESTGELFSHLENALKLAEKALTEDANRNYDNALEFYSTSLEHFVKAYDVEKNPEIKKSIMNKINEFMSRAEKIKAAIKKSSLTSSNSSKQLVVSKVEVSSAASQYVAKAIDLVEAGVDSDECGKIDEAIENYQNALNQFTMGLQNETNSEIKAMIKEKMVSTNTRIEKLKQFKSTGSVVIQPIAFGLKPGEKYLEPRIASKKITQ